MGLLIILGVLAIPAILVLLITRGRGNPPPDAIDDEFEPSFDSVLGLRKQDLGRELTDIDRQ